MTKIGLVSNPHSQQNKRGLSEIDAAAGRAGIVHRRLSDMDELRDALTDLAEQDVEVLAVNGGDGTVQAVLTELLEQRPFANIPTLALLPRGMTNMTAADVGLRGRPDRALARLANLARSGRLESCLTRRSVLRLENIPGFPPQRGMFFGAGAIYRAIEYCRAEVHPLRVEADWAAGLTLLRLLSGLLLRRGGNDVVTGDRVAASFDDGPGSAGLQLFVLATTLDRLVLGSKPYWNQNAGPVRYTALSYPPIGLVRWAPRVMYGGNDRKLPSEGYMSRGAQRVNLEMGGPFTLDGQSFDAPVDKPLVLTAPEVVDFVRC